MRDSIQFGSKKIIYELQYLKRKTLGITVTPEMNVLVTAPDNAQLEKIRTIVRKRAPWILKQQDFFLSFHPKTPAKKFVSGETHLYLGRAYKLKVSVAKKNAVILKGREIEVQAKVKRRAKAILTSWYAIEAKIKFIEIAKPWIQKFGGTKVQPKSISIREMKNRWGSCTSKSRIILNPELIKAPKQCIEYVIVHELCHLVHHSHNQKFFDLQKKVMPDWEKRKMKLEKVLS
jgi:predicted metal-dependent hydrolase